MIHSLYELKFLREGIADNIGARVVEDLLPISSDLNRKASIVGMKSTGSPPGFMDLEKRFSRHARRTCFVLPSKRSFRAFQAAAPSLTQLSSLLSCARTVMCTDPSVMKNRTEKRLLLAFFEASCSFTGSGQGAPAEDVKHLQRMKIH